MKRKLDQVVELRRAMTEAASWNEHRESVRDFITPIEDALREAIDDLLSGEEIVEAGARRAVLGGLADDWMNEDERAYRLKLSRNLLSVSLIDAQEWFEARGALYQALAKELKAMRRRIPAIAQRAPDGVHQHESLREAIERAAAAGDAEAGVIAAWVRLKGET
jgi:ATP/maltotriose-dependent transcriptional regulator MalT